MGSCLEWVLTGQRRATSSPAVVGPGLCSLVSWRCFRTWALPCLTLSCLSLGCARSQQWRPPGRLPQLRVTQGSFSRQRVRGLRGSQGASSGDASLGRGGQQSPPRHLSLPSLDPGEGGPGLQDDPVPCGSSILPPCLEGPFLLPCPAAGASQTLPTSVGLSAPRSPSFPGGIFVSPFLSLFSLVRLSIPGFFLFVLFCFCHSTFCHLTLYIFDLLSDLLLCNRKFP